MNCPSCSFSSPAGFKFCGQCGSALCATPKLEAERRQITVMFCDLVGSTDLSAAIDPEELRELVRAYQAICAEVFEKNQGHVAQYLGDGILAYFGYPVAYEDSPSMAVESALEIHVRMADWNKTVPQDIQLRTGIHTGTVVVGEMGAGAHKENLAMGETPNLAARLQGLAQPGEVVVSDDTYHLTSHRVAAESLGLKSLKGLPQPKEVFLLKGVTDRKARRRMARARRANIPLLGYRSQREGLWSLWQRAKESTGSGVALVGDAGIGKSRMAQWLKDRICREESFLVSLYPTFETSLTPLVSVLENLHQEFDSESDFLKKCPDPEQSRLLKELLEVEQGAMVPGRQKQRLQAVVKLWARMSAERPLLVVCEDCEHLDSVSMTLLRMLMGALPDNPMMLVTVWRSEPQDEWGEILKLTGLATDDLVTLAKLTANEKISHDTLVAIAARAEGNPLFAEELARNPSAKSTARLHDLFMARLDSFGERKPTLQRLSAVGRRFNQSLVQALDDTTDEPIREVIDESLTQLILQQEDQEFSFRQGLFHQTCYNSLLRKSRQRFHNDVAASILEHLPSWADDAPETLAYHLSRGSSAEQSVPYLQKAGNKAMRMSAELEAIGHFSKALELLPDSLSVVGQRIELLLSLGSAHIATKGYAHPEVQSCFQQAREICAQIGDPEPTFPALCGLWAYNFVAGNLSQGMEIAQRLLDLAGEVDERRLAAHASCGQTCFILGEFDEAVKHFEAVRRLENPDHHESLAFSYFATDPAVASISYYAWISHLRGQNVKSRAQAEEVLAKARALGQAHTIAHTLFFDGILAYESGDETRFATRTAELYEVSVKCDFQLWLALAGAFEAIARKDPELYIARLGLLQQTGTKMGETWFLFNAYRLLKAADQSEKAVHVLQQVRQIAAERGEKFYLSQLDL